MAFASIGEYNKKKGNHNMILIVLKCLLSRSRQRLILGSRLTPAHCL